MELTLKTGKKVFLEWNSLVFEYLEEYKSGIEELNKDLNRDNSRMYACNHVIYSVIAASIDEEITYRQAVKLVNVEDISKIVDFVLNNVIKMEKDLNNMKSTVDNYNNHFK